MDAASLQQAAAQAKTLWLERALTNLLPQVWYLTPETPGWEESAAQWANQIDLLFEHQKLTTPNQQKNRRTDIANALRTIRPSHPAIPFVLLPSEVYTQLNNEQASRLNARANKFFSTQQADQLVERAIHLLESPKPDDMAAGLAVLVGRRISEILISGFRPKTAYSLLFSEAVKRRGEVGMEFEIPTLAIADQVLEAIHHLKQVWSIADLQALDLPDNHLKRRINARYSGVPHACRQHFADLVPGREAENDDGDRLYTHLFRAVYAEIATYYYKPDWVPDHRFKAEIQGHFKLTADGQRIPNYSARQNYDDYLLGDRNPGIPGVKLEMPGVQILEVFQRKEVTDKEKVSRMLDTGIINALIYRAVDQLLFSKQWAEAGVALVLLTGRTIQTLMEKSLEERSGFSILVDELEVPTLTGANQVVAAWKKWRQLEPLPEVQVDAAIREVGDRSFHGLLPLQSVQELRAVYGAISTLWFCPPEIEPQAFLKAIQASESTGFVTGEDRGIKLGQHNVQTLQAFTQEVTEMIHEPVEATQPSPKPKSRPRRKSLSVDPDLLRAAAYSLGIEIRGKGGTGSLTYEAALAQLLQHLAQGHPQTTPHDEGAISTIKDQARTLAWLTGRIEDLEHQVEQLQLEKDQALHQVQQTGESTQLEQLQEENQRLREERDQATSKLQAFRHLLLGSGTHQEQPSTDDKITQQVEPAIPTPTQSPSTSSEPPKPSRKRTSEEDALGHIRNAVQAIIAFNDQEGRSFDDKWYISFPVVQSLLRANGLSANQKIVTVVFEELKQELEKHHERHQLGSRHNRRHPDVGKIKEMVQLG